MPPPDEPESAEHESLRLILEAGAEVERLADKLASLRADEKAVKLKLGIAVKHRDGLIRDCNQPLWHRPAEPPRPLLDAIEGPKPDIPATFSVEPEAEPIDPMNQPLSRAATDKLMESVYKPDPAKPERKKPGRSFDVFVWNASGPKELVGTIEAPARTAKAALKTIARDAFPGRLRGLADMEIVVLPTPKTTGERSETYGMAEPDPPLSLFLVAPSGKKPVYAVRAPSLAAATKYAKTQHPKPWRGRVWADDGTVAKFKIPVTATVEPQGDPAVLAELTRDDERAQARVEIHRPDEEDVA